MTRVASASCPARNVSTKCREFEKTFSPAVQVLPQGPDGSARAEPYTLALSHDETRLALAFPPPSGSESDPWLIDIHATSNLRAGDGRAI
eukprot:35665-Eustigmatos_ZCMA.PRE.1